jgi:hypothetical protein
MADATVRALADRAAIQDVIAAYFFAIDRRDWDGVAACFTADADCDYRVFRGTPDVAVAAMRKGLAQFEHTMHFGGPPRITVDGDSADAECYAVCYHRLAIDGVPHDRTSALHYQDRFARTRDGWRIASRRITFLWERLDRTALPPPPTTPR